MAFALVVLECGACATANPPTSSPAQILQPKITTTIAKGTPLAAPDGLRIAIEEPASISFYDIQGHTLGQVVPAAAGVATFSNIGFSWLPDSSGLLLEVRISNQIGLVVVERDFSVRVLPLRNVGHASVYLSPDGTTFVAQAGNDIVTFGRDGRGPATVATGQDAVLIGWDEAGQILMKDGPAIRAVGPDPYTIPMPTDFPTEAKRLAAIGSSPDGTVHALLDREGLARALFIAGRHVHIAHGVMGWVGGHEYLTQHDGGFFVEDGSTGASQPATGVPPNARVKAEVGERVVWATEATGVHVTPAKGGTDVTLANAPAGLEGFFGALGTHAVFLYQEGSLSVFELPGTT
jgi:hypothetical protein